MADIYPVNTVFSRIQVDQQLKQFFTPTHSQLTRVRLFKKAARSIIDVLLDVEITWQPLSGDVRAFCFCNSVARTSYMLARCL